MTITPLFPPREYRFLLLFMMKSHSLLAELLFQQSLVEVDEMAAAF